MENENLFVKKKMDSVAWKLSKMFREAFVIHYFKN